MDITITGRNVGITDRFREYAVEKSDRVTNLADRALALEVRLCRHHETHGSSGDDRVELTLIGPGPVVRAEAGGVDKYAAYDAALAKLLEHIRRARDRKKLHRGHGSRMTSLREASASGFQGVGVVPADGDSLRRAATGPTGPETLPPTAADVRGAQPGGAEDGDEESYTPINIRRKIFEAAPMSVDDALYRMELVGHDFYLYFDSETQRPSVVYRRKGWDYGVIGLQQQAVPGDVPDGVRDEARDGAPVQAVGGAR